MKLIVKRIVAASAPVVLAIAAACTGQAEGSTPPTISPDVFAPIPTPRPFGRTPTPTATPFLIPIPTVAISETATPTATPSATIGAPGPEPTPEASATAAPTPTVAPTAQPTAGSTVTPTPEPTVEPTPTVVPTATPTQIPTAPGGVAFSVEQDAITLTTEQVAPESLSAGVNVSDFSVEVTLGNPVNPNFSDYSYGIKFRESDGAYQAVSINNDGAVRYLAGTVGTDGATDSFEVLNTFDYQDVLTAGSESNKIHLTVIGEKAWLFINEDYLGEFAVTDPGISSDVAVIAELDNETGVEGAITDVNNLTVRSTADAAASSSGTLVTEEGGISRTEATGTLRDSVIEITFKSPHERILGKWSVGLEYTEPVSGTANLLIFNNSKKWKHLRRDGFTDEVVEVASGNAAQILNDRGDLNTLTMIGRNGIYDVFINGVFVTRVTLDPETELPANVSAVAGIEAGDQAGGIPTDYQDYTVWSFGS